MRMPWFEHRDAMAYDFTDLELFLQVVDQGSITQGAERALFATSVALLVRSATQPRAPPQKNAGV